MYRTAPLNYIIDLLTYGFDTLIWEIDTLNESEGRPMDDYPYLGLIGN